MAGPTSSGPALGAKASTGSGSSWGVTENVRLNPQEMVGQFRVEAELGHGAFGSVYRAYDTVLERAVAIKVVFPELAHAESAFKQLVREHDARSKVRDFGHILRASSPQRCEYQGLVAIVLPMPLASRSLRSWLSERPSQKEPEAYKAWLAQTMKYFQQACAGVQAIHEAGLTHLDLKPENILLVPVEDEKELQAQVADFGLARTKGQGGQRGVGTLAYMAPEQFRGRAKDLGPDADVYSLGCILFEIIDGDPPFEGDTPEEYQQMHQDLEPPTHRWQGVDAAVVEVAKKCLSKRSTDRYATAAVLLQRLQLKPEVKESVAEQPPVMLSKPVAGNRRLAT